MHSNILNVLPIIGGGGSIGVVVFNAKPYTIKASDGKLLSFDILAGVFISLPNEKQWKKLHRMTKKNKHKVQEKGAHYSQSKKILQKKTFTKDIPKRLKYNVVSSSS